MRILVVEDEKRLAQTLADLLMSHNYLVDIVYDGEDGLDYALSGIYDAILLDVMLPKLDGFTVLQKLRAKETNLPVLMLTAKSELHDRVAGLNMGSDYYLTKPFEASELLACLRAITRRKGEIQTTQLSFGDIVVDIDSAELCSGERSVRLRAKELEILRLLVENEGNIVLKDTLQLKVWGYDSTAEANVLEVYISFIRKKLQHVYSNVKIVAERLLGYRLEIGND